MSPKNKRRTLQLIGFLIGLTFGYFRPAHMQNLIPILAIGVGIGYFIFSTKIGNDDQSIDEITWFPLIQMIMYFLIGGVLSSSLLMSLRMLQMQ